MKGGIIVVAALIIAMLSEHNLDQLQVYPKQTTILKAIYINYGVTQNKLKMSKILTISKRSGINAFVIDIHSTGGPLMFENDNETRRFLKELKEQGFYLIARIVVFKGGPKGWYDPKSKRRWEEVVEVSRRAIQLEFDEINYDYVRYGARGEPPSPTPINERIKIIRSFFEFIKSEVRDKTGRPISVDIFGWAFIAPQYVIGQRVEDAVSNFDYVMPMVYPSHWGRNNLGIPVPGREPYLAVYRSLSLGWNKVKNNPRRIAEMRAWIQAFDLESINPIRIKKYGPAEIKAQIKACYDAGCQGWALWNSASNYAEISLKEAVSVK